MVESGQAGELLRSFSRDEQLVGQISGFRRDDMWAKRFLGNLTD